MISLFLLLSTLTGIFLVVGWFIGGVAGITMALVLALGINLVSYWYSDKIVLKLFGAVPTDHLQLRKIAEKLATEAKIPVPRLYMIPTKPTVMNAFATGRSPSNAAIAVTRGLLTLHDDEIEAVVAHEMAHIKNRDTLVSTIAAVLAGAVSYLAQIGYWSFFGQRRDEANVVSLLFIVFFAPLAATLVRLAISRSREYGADYLGVLLCKKPKALVSALTKISESSRESILHGSVATSHMWIVNPFHKDWFTELFSTHPPISDRIKKIEEINKLRI